MTERHSTPPHPLPDGIRAIRRATEEDAAAIARFNREMALETEGLSLDRDTVEAGVRALFSRPDLGFYLVADTGGDAGPAGALMVTFEWSDWRNGVFWWIQSVYVRPEWRRRGIYRALHRRLQADAAAQESPRVCGFRLYVEKANRQAQATYRELGMDETGYRMFESA